MAAPSKRRTPPAAKAPRSRARRAEGVDEMLVKLGERIRELRLAAGLSQERCAAAAEIASKRLQDIEHGKGNPTAATLYGIARACGVTLAELFAGV